MHRGNPKGVAVALLIGAAAVAVPTQAVGQDPFVWENATELSFVSTGGNASSSSLGLKAALTGTGGQNTFKLEVGGIRSETNLTTRTATGTATQFNVNETTISQLTAENYFLRGRYDRSLDVAYSFVGAGWDRNTFAGVQNRYALVAGFGKTLVEGDSGHFKADLGATYTIQKDVDPAPGADDAFGGARLTVDAARELSATTAYTTALIVDQNLEETDDLRADWINSLSVTLNSNLALKASVQLLYDKLPSLLSVPLFDTGGVPTGDVLTPGDTVDNILTLTLVITL